MQDSTSAAADQTPHVHSTSDLLIGAVRGEGERIAIGQILDALDTRAFGFAILLFSIPSCVPMPPGVPTVVGIVLLMISIQMVMGRQELWLPRFLTSKSFSRPALISGLEKFKPWLEKVERLARPRMLWMTGAIGTWLVGAMVLLMAIILILPLPPGGNFPPAITCAILAIGLIERDGLMVLIGWLVAVFALYFVYKLTDVFLASLPAIGDWFGRLFGG
jgi:hypothetical protein